MCKFYKFYICAVVGVITEYHVYYFHFYIFSCGIKCSKSTWHHDKLRTSYGRLKFDDVFFFLITIINSFEEYKYPLNSLKSQLC